MAGEVKSGLAIIAGRGALPRMLAHECKRIDRLCYVVFFDPVQPDWSEGFNVIAAEFERLGAMFDALNGAATTSVVFAGAMNRPELDPAKFDAGTLEILPKLIPHLGKGDDATLRAIAGVFEDKGFTVEAAHDVLASLIAGEGALGALEPNDSEHADCLRAAEIASALGVIDVGQGAVVAQGICLGAETIQGTDRMLNFVAETRDGYSPDPNGSRGVLFKGPKPGQDLRVDMPAIGPATIENAAKAGLAGVAVRAGGVLMLELEETIVSADRLGLFVYGLAGDSG